MDQNTMDIENFESAETNWSLDSDIKLPSLVEQNSLDIHQNQLNLVRVPLSDKDLTEWLRT
jgi:hypothetical protein